MTNSEWNYIPAEKFCLRVTDGTHDTPKKSDTGKPLITSKHIKGSEIDFESAYLISEEDFNFINKRSAVEQWDVIISMIGAYCGYCFIEKNADINYAVKNVGLFKTGSQLNARWLYYYLQSQIGKAHLDAIKSGSSQPYLSLGGLRSLPVLVPDQDSIKRKIIDVVSAIDQKIEINNRINAELGAMAKTLYDYWFVQFDFPDENGRPYKSSGGKMVYNTELKREIPASIGWRVSQFGRELETVLGGTPSTQSAEYWGGDIPWLNSGEISQFPVVQSEKTITEKGIKNSAADFLPRGSVVVSIVRYIRPSILAIGAATSQSVVGLLESENLKNSFIYPALANDVPRLMSLRAGAQQPHINKGTIDSSHIIIPAKEVLEKYYQVAEPIYRQLINKAFDSQRLVELRDWLLPMLMNGQVRVESAAKAVSREV